jgi:hypothetical protein
MARGEYCRLSLGGEIFGAVRRAAWLARVETRLQGMGRGQGKWGASGGRQKGVPRPPAHEGGV